MVQMEFLTVATNCTAITTVGTPSAGTSPTSLLPFGKPRFWLGSRDSDTGHFMRNLLGLVPRGAKPLVGGMGADDLRPARPSGSAGATGAGCWGPGGEVPEGRGAPVGGGRGCDRPHGVPTGALGRTHSTNVLGRLHREIKRRSDVVGIFPSIQSALRLIGAILEEQGGSGRPCVGTSVWGRWPCSTGRRLRSPTSTRWVF